MRLFNHQWSKKKTRLNEIINQRFYRINQSKSKSDLSIAKLIASSIRIRSVTTVCTFIDRLFIICSTYFFDNCTNQHLFTIYFANFSTIARTFYSLQFEKKFEIYAFANQINVFFSISFEKFFDSFVNIIFYLFICFASHFHWNSKYLTQIYEFAR